MNPLPTKFEEIAKLYAQTKYLIIKAEELDPELKSCVPIIKELRDAFDHTMRYVGDYFSASPKGTIYQEAQLDKVIGHVFRASYDALDCLSIALKMRLNNAMDGKSHDAISTVFPSYFQTHVVKLQEIDLKIIESRQLKDVGGYSPAHLEKYLAFLENLQAICVEAESRVPEMVRFDKAKNKRGNFTTFLAILGPIVGFIMGYFLRK